MLMPYEGLILEYHHQHLARYAKNDLCVARSTQISLREKIGTWLIRWGRYLVGLDTEWITRPVNS